MVTVCMLTILAALTWWFMGGDIAVALAAGMFVGRAAERGNQRE